MATEPGAVPVATPVEAPAQPVATRHPERVLYGDLHIHTALSADAFSTGTRTLPDDAYRYARGEAIPHARRLHGAAEAPARFRRRHRSLRVPRLDARVPEPREPAVAAPLAKLFASPDPADAFKALMQISDDASHDGSLDELLDLPEVNKAAWREVIAAAERHNEPGRFTTLIGYEWTSTPDEINLHRNVIFRGSAVPEKPFSRIDSDKPEDLWRFLDQQRANGIEGMAIPHNSNASDGHDVGAHGFPGSTGRRGVGAPAQPQRADRRDRADQGPVGGTPAALDRGRVRELRDVGPPACRARRSRAPRSPRAATRAMR